ncbi:LysR family transcriptional regulator [Bacillus massiliigorillae]|uniref:LysR family transcriptional regulator n=1 Tax=Bacillus massiliigorillae TaxID=1243664 RepID=UPI0003A11998|nr:LysR family transcriptional regulator [Bacillus massiliigorillae]
MKQQLHVFIKVVELKSFSRAAEELYMTQPAVSQYIQSLEESVGTKLLERTNKIISLTKAGEIVYIKGKEILRLYGKMHHLIEDLTNQAKGSISIGASYTFGEYILPHVIAAMKENYPSIKPTISIGNTKEIIELVKNNSLDIGIIEGDLDNQRTLTIEQFAEDTLFIVASALCKGICDKKIVTLQDLEDETWIIRESGSGTREATDKMFRKLGINPQNKMEFGSTQVIKESVEAGLGITFISKASFRKEQALQTLQVVKGEDYYLKRHFSYVVKSSFQTKAVELFIELLKQSV